MEDESVNRALIVAGVLGLSALASGEQPPDWGVGVRDVYLGGLGQADIWSAAKVIGVSRLEVLVDRQLACAGLFEGGAHPYRIDTPENRQTLQKAFGDHGLIVSCLCAGVGGQDGPAEGSVGWLERVMEAAAALKVEVIMVPLGYGAKSDEDFVRQSIALLQALAPIVERTGRTLAIENLGLHLNRREVLLPIHRAVPGKHIGLAHDVANMYWFGHALESVYELASNVAPYVRYVHVKNIRYPADARGIRRAPGWEYGKYADTVRGGDIDFDKVIAIYAAAGFRGDLTIEDDSLGKLDAGGKRRALIDDAKLLRKIIERHAQPGRGRSAGAVASAGERLVLVENGRGRSAIVAAKTIGASERFAVEELQSFIQQISGAKLPVCEPGQLPPEGKPGAWIVVGKKTAEERHEGLRLDELGAEGFIVRTIGDDLVLAGSEQRGTLYGVYAFLESLGCRWWSDDASTIPSLSTLRVPDTDRREMPRLEYRDLLYQEQWGATIWGVRNRITNMTGGASEIPERWGGTRPAFHTSLVHSWVTLIKLDGSLDYENKAGKDDPTWHALVPDGQGKLSRVRSQPCTRHPQVRQAILNGALKMLRQHPADAFVTVGQEDGPEYCHCTQYGCADLVASEGSASALVLDMANAVADRMAQEFPGKSVMAPAYAWGIQMPRTMRPRDNIIISVAPIENDFGHAVATGEHEQNIKFRARMDEWAKAAKKIYVWDYLTNFTHYLMPHPNLDVLAPNIKYYADHHVTGYMAQGSHTCINAEFSRLRMWVLARAMWNPEADNGALVAEFCNGYYGPAGPAVLKYIDAIHKPVRNEESLYVTCYNDFTAPWLAPDILAEAEACLREAEAAVANDAVRSDRVRLAHVPLQYVLAVRQPTSATWERIERKLGRIDPVAFANGLADLLDQFFTKTGKPWGMDESGGHGFADFSAYLRQWALKARTNGDALPPELIGVTDRYRLIHPWQIDQQNMSWGTRPFPDPDASDGYAMRAKDEGWTMGYRFVAGDDYTPGKRYKLRVRVRCPQPERDGDAFSCGIYGQDPLPRIDKTIATKDLTPGRYQTIEVGTIELKPGHSFWICTAKRKGEYAVTEVRLDCLWLSEARQ